MDVPVTISGRKCLRAYTAAALMAVLFACSVYLAYTHARKAYRAVGFNDGPVGGAVAGSLAGGAAQVAQSGCGCP